MRRNATRPHARTAVGSGSEVLSVSLKQLFVACVGLGFGSAFAAWVIRELVGIINAFSIGAYNVWHRRNSHGAYAPCVKCAAQCTTILQCTSESCGWVHQPSADVDSTVAG